MQQSTPGCGLELAIDSFALRFFKDMDFEQALEAWRVSGSSVFECMADSIVKSYSYASHPLVPSAKSSLMGIS